MIIWGSKGRTNTVGRGTFSCPKCRRQTAYKHESAGKYFTLYFIPIFKTKDLGDFIECQSCFLTFKPEVLQMTAQFEEDRVTQERIAGVIMDLRKQLESGVPVQAIAQGLEESGMPEEVIMKIMFEAADGKFRECPQCSSAYSSRIKYCSICGTQLPIERDFG